MVRYIRENVDFDRDFNDFDFGGEWVVDVPKECIKGATLLSIEEYEKYKENIPLISDYWWLRTSGYDGRGAGVVDCDGGTYRTYNVQFTDYYIRPVLILNFQSSNLNFGVGDKLEFGEHIFTVISNDSAICDDFIGESCFRSWDAPDASIYEKSTIKKKVDNWFNEAYKNYEG